MRGVPKPIVVYGYNYARHVVYVRYVKHPLDGYLVRRRDNQRLLGLVRRDGKKWTYVVHQSAFRGIGIDDLGHVRDVVPPTLYGPIAHRLATREFAAQALCAFLVQHHAPAVGFPAHRDVRPHVELRVVR